jgi:hypothetical protein
MKSPLSKLARWLIFTVMVALVPVLYTVLNRLTFSKRVSLATVTAHGELLLIATAIGGSAIGELIGSGTRKRRVHKITCAGVCLVAIMMSTSWFADIASAQEANVLMNPTLVGYGSLTMIILMLLAGVGCVVLSEA